MWQALIENPELTLAAGFALALVIRALQGQSIHIHVVGATGAAALRDEEKAQPKSKRSVS